MAARNVEMTPVVFALEISLLCRMVRLQVYFILAVSFTVVPCLHCCTLPGSQHASHLSPMMVIITAFRGHHPKPLPCGDLAVLLLCSLAVIFKEESAVVITALQKAAFMS